MASDEFNGIFRAIDDMPNVLKRKYLTKAAKAGAQVQLDMMRDLCPVATGNLRDSLIMSVARESNADEVVVRTGPDKKMGYIAHFIEFGTGAHEIRADAKSMLASEFDVFGKTVSHPGIKARPFMRPALTNTAGAAKAIAAGVLADLIEEFEKK